MTEESKDRQDESAANTAPDHQPTEQLPAANSSAEPRFDQASQSGPAAPPYGPAESQVRPSSAQQPDSAWRRPDPAQPGGQPQFGSGEPQFGGTGQYGPQPEYSTQSGVFANYPPGPNPTQPFPGPEYAAMSFEQPAPPPGQVPGAAFGAQPPQPRRTLRGSLIAGAVVLAVLSGGAGGAVGALVAHNNGTSTVTNALDAPKPNISNASSAPPGSVQAVAQKVLPSVVTIKVAGSRAEGEGSGVVLSSDGLILTNNHVAGGAGPNAKMQVVFSDNSTAPATLVGADPVSDLAVIRVSGKNGLTPIELGTSANLQVGQPVVAIGAPLGLSGTVTTGIVSALNRPVSTQGEGAPQSQAAVNPVIDAIQTDAAINPGNSGGALVDGSGKLVGINTAIATLGASEMPGLGQQQSGSIGLGFAIPVDQARRVADELSKTGHATYAQIGIKIQAQDPVNGARVLEATPDGPAAKAGIPAGVVVTKVDNRNIDSGDALVAAIRSHAPGDKVKITYTDDQGNNPKTVEVTLAGAPADGGR
ncbi:MULTISPECIES: S1C family serine protease [unclassified Nocardia]|uniref:S1C family serine protease n=1 Tax=unclassified Nocardia TaxID=2637762 RepID=UPI001CE4AEBD|nr:MULTISPECIES: trypsin-like peptidase domain-containing protein [unclassified Nocardia]